MIWHGLCCVRSGQDNYQLDGTEQELLFLKMVSLVMEPKWESGNLKKKDVFIGFPKCIYFMCAVY